MSILHREQYIFKVLAPTYESVSGPLNARCDVL